MQLTVRQIPALYLTDDERRRFRWLIHCEIGMLKGLLIAGALAATCSGSAYAQTPAGMAAADFITAASQSDMFEIQEGKLAQTMGSPAVRRFGARMVKDHMKTTANLHAAIRKAGMAVPPPPALRPDQEQMMGQLRSLSGPSFGPT